MQHSKTTIWEMKESRIKVSLSTTGSHYHSFIDRQERTRRATRHPRGLSGAGFRGGGDPKNVFLKDFGDQGVPSMKPIHVEEVQGWGNSHVRKPDCRLQYYAGLENAAVTTDKNDTAVAKATTDSHQSARFSWTTGKQKTCLVYTPEILTTDPLLTMNALKKRVDTTTCGRQSRLESLHLPRRKPGAGEWSGYKADKQRMISAPVQIYDLIHRQLCGERTYKWWRWHPHPFTMMNELADVVKN